MKLTVKGRTYQEAKKSICFECRRGVLELVKAEVKPAFLSCCDGVLCRVLLCYQCRDMHQSIHALAGEEERPVQKTIFPRIPPTI